MDVTPPGTAFWLKWLVSFLGFPLGGSLAYALVRSVDGTGDALVAGAAAGAVIGAAQWLVLRTPIAMSPWWVVATAAGLGIGLALGAGLFGEATSIRPLVLRALVTGIVVGAAQWIVLRQFVAMASWWVPAVGLSWTAGWMVTRGAGVDLSRGWTVFGATGALAFAALTGAVMVWLLRLGTKAP